MKLWKLRLKIMLLQIAAFQAVTTAVIPPMAICFKMSHFMSVGMFLVMSGAGLYAGLMESCFSPSNELEKRIENLGEQIQFNAVASPFTTAAVVVTSLFFTK